MPAKNLFRIALLLTFLTFAVSIGFAAPASTTDPYQTSPTSVSIYSQPGPEWVNLLPANAVVLQEVVCDMTGDGVADTLLLTGSKETISAHYFRHLALAFMDGATGSQQVQPLSMAGYSPQLKSVYLLSKDTPAFLVSAPTGGSGGIVDNRIISFMGGFSQVLFDEAANKGLKIEGIFLPDYQVRVTFPALKQSITFDRSYAKSDYQRMGLYTEDGAPVGKKEAAPWIDPFSALTVMNRNKDGLNRLQGIQQIAGAYHADRLATATSTWFYGNDQWQVEEVVITTKLVKSTKPE